MVHHYKTGQEGGFPATKEYFMNEGAEENDGGKKVYKAFKRSSMHLIC